jgi:outer membrane protein OmpA-like peptidoglycan-associated protein
MIKQVGIAGALALLAIPALAAEPGGFYVGIGGGINYPLHSDVDGTVGGVPFKLENIKSKMGFTGNAFAGYSFGFPRVELELVYRQNKTKDIAVLGGANARVQSGAAMVNMLFDFFPTSVVSPYLGIGAGAAYVHINKPNKDADVVPAAQGIAGANLKLTPNWLLSADYRYFRTIDPHMSSNGTKYDFDYANHTGMLGVTYRFVQPPRPLAVPATVVQPPPPPQVTRNYMVFFDFDKSDITPQALMIIREAAANARNGSVQRLNVTGHADRSGTEQYNQALSVRRANAVRDVLVREGLSPDQIVVVGRGESQPLVPTPDGVREAQNRRVEIVLQ